VSPNRVRALISSRELAAVKIGDRWLVEDEAVERRLWNGAHPGRRFSPSNAWALLVLASGEEARGIGPSIRSRLERALAREGLASLRPRLSKRGEARLFQAHPGELAYLLEDPRFVRSGATGAQEHGFGLVAGGQVEGYVRAADLDDFVAHHALEPTGVGGNVRARAVPDEAWRFLDDRRVAPRAAVTLDLLEDLDPRSAQAAHKALRELDGVEGDALARRP
jgi:hypothetical protein